MRLCCAYTDNLDESNEVHQVGSNMSALPRIHVQTIY